jgi:uncharacterized protein
MLRIAILSDTHGVLSAEVAALVTACDLAVHGGDVGGAAVLDALRPRQGRIVAVRGNNDLPDKWPSQDRERLSALPLRDTLELPGGLLVVEHGHRALPATRRHAVLRARYPQARAVVYGHSHHLILDQDALPWVLNPGAAGRARTYGGPSCILLHIRGEHWSLEARRF